MRDHFRIAAGPDNEDEVLRFADYDPCLFQGYRRYVKWTFHAAEEIKVAGTRLDKLIGLPWGEIEFPWLEPTEWEFLITTFGYSSDVTIHALNEDNDTYYNYNAKIHIPINPERIGGGYAVTIEFRDLREIV